jgi:hypothetical protein
VIRLPFASTDKLKHGDTLVVAAPGFSCFKAGDAHVVVEDLSGLLWCRCRFGAFHALDGHVSADGNRYMGFYKIDAPPSAGPRPPFAFGTSGLATLVEPASLAVREASFDGQTPHGAPEDGKTASPRMPPNGEPGIDA